MEDSEQASLRLNEKRHARDEQPQKSRYSLKNVVSTILRNIKNVFLKDENNQPNEVLLRTILIKKLILYLVVVLISISSFYLIYETIYKETILYNFKVQSTYKITRYHNTTLSVLNEYLYRESILQRLQDNP